MSTTAHKVSSSVSGAAGAADVDRLLAAGKAKQAVELAKQLHKQSNTPDTEKQLVSAYIARIEQFHNQAMYVEAKNLLELVCERYSSGREALGRIRFRSAMAAGNLGEVLAPLASEQTSPDDRQYIEELIRTQWTDLPGLARSEALPPEHPLRAAASAVWTAFEAVTSGPVDDPQIALAMVSRRSPLAGWKLLIRAIAAFYRKDDEGARRALDGIAPGAAVERLAAVMRRMIDGSVERTGQAGVLYARVIQDDRSLREALTSIDTALQRCSPALLKKSIREAITQCSIVMPEFLERLKQHISVASALSQCPAEEVLRVMGSSRKDAFFWRLLARSAELSAPPPIAALYWERFLRHAVAEKAFAENSLEAAAVWLRIAGAISRESPEELAEFRRRLAGMKIISPYYDEQPSAISALRPASDHQLMLDVLDTGSAFVRSARLSPRPETFRQWWAWAQRIELPVRQKEDVALAWHKGAPADAEPLVILCDLAEGRKALNLAVKRLGEAEAIDPLNTRVRQARLRLTLAVTWRHFSDRKPQLVEKDLADLAALPSMMEVERQAFLACMRAAWHLLRGEAALATECATNAVAALGPLAGHAIFNSVLRIAKLKPDTTAPVILCPPQATPREIAQAEAKGMRLSRDLGVNLHRPPEWDPAIDIALQERPCGLSGTEILQIGIGATSRSNTRQAYLASSAGLARAEAPASISRLLLIRARTFNPIWGKSRAAQCLRAAMTLARTSHDEALTADILAEIDRARLGRWCINDAPMTHPGAIEPTVLDLILTNERKAEAYPETQAQSNAFLVPDADAFEDDNRSGSSPFDVGSFFDDADAEHEDDEESAGSFDFASPDDDGSFDTDSDPVYVELFKGLPREFRARLEQVIRASGLTPDDIQRNPRRFLEAVAASAGLSVEELNRASGMPESLPFDSFAPAPQNRNKRHKNRRRR
jgi:hypothetical protein